MFFLFNVDVLKCLKFVVKLIWDILFVVGDLKGVLYYCSENQSYLLIVKLMFLVSWIMYIK